MSACSLQTLLCFVLHSCCGIHHTLHASQEHARFDLCHSKMKACNVHPQVAVHLPVTGRLYTKSGWLRETSDCQNVSRPDWLVTHKQLGCALTHPKFVQGLVGWGVQGVGPLTWGPCCRCCSSLGCSRPCRASCPTHR